jgi:hypothetical protein
MGKFKESNRKQINIAAGNFLSEQEEGDYYDAYLKLLEESDKGNDDCTAADFVTVWQPLEHLSVAKMIETIENAIVIDAPEMPDFMKKIDWTLLKQQKKDVFAVIQDIDDVQKLESLEGIICLLNSLQDAAVDIYGLDENLVFEMDEDEDKG